MLFWQTITFICMVTFILSRQSCITACNSIAPCMDGVVVLVAVRTSQSTTISSWSSYYILVGGNVKLNSNYITDRSSSAYICSYNRLWSENVAVRTELIVAPLFPAAYSQLESIFLSVVLC